MADLTLAAYQKYSATGRADPADDLLAASVVRLAWGLQGPAEAEIDIPREAAMPILLSGSDRIATSDGQTIIHEGMIRTRSYRIGSGAEQSVSLEFPGFWGALLARRTIDKRWADNRLTDDIWPLQDTVGVDKCGVNNTDGLGFVPKNEQWHNGEHIARRYKMPTGQTVKRITFNYDLQEVAEDSPKKAFHFDSAGPSYTDMPNTVDGSASTSNTVTLTTGDYLYIDLRDGTDYDGIYIDFGGTVNANTATLSAQYGQVDSAGNETYASVSITDGTASGGRTFAQDGLISFTRPNDVAVTNVNSNRRAWIRLSVSANLTASVVINEIYLRKTQSWKLSLYNVSTATEIVTVTASGTGSIDHPLATPSQSVELRFVSLAKQTPPSNGSVYGKFSDIMVYSETGNITMYEIARDCVGTLSTANVLNSTEVFLNDAASPLALEPFFTIGPESWASILSRAAAFGDDAQNEWRAYIRPSDDAPAPNGRPVLALEQYDALGTATYAVTIDELEERVEIVENFDGIANWIAVAYRTDDGRILYVTPDDDSSLKDQTSINLWGEMPLEQPLYAGTNTQAGAVSLGQRYLAAHKDPKFIVSGPLMVKGTIRGSGDKPVRVTQIQAGKNIKIENFLDDLAGVNGAGLTFRITRVAYNDATETAEIYTGLIPDSLEILLAQMAAGLSAASSGGAVIDPFPFGNE